MLKDHLEYKVLLKFDPRIDWSEWQTLCGFAYIGSHRRHYITYGGGPEGGIVKSYGDGWYIWLRSWGEKIQYIKTTDERGQNIETMMDVKRSKWCLWVLMVMR